MWTAAQEKFIVDNYDKIPHTEIESSLVKTRSQVQYKIKELRGLGVLPSPSKLYDRLCRKYQAKNIAFVKEFYPKYGSNFCASKTGLTVRQIQNIVVAVGLRVRNNHANITRKSLYYFDYTLFERPTAEFAYLLGFIWGDGFIKNDRIACSNLREDIQCILPIFFKTGKWSVVPVRKNNSDGAKRQESWCVSIQDDQFSKFLFDHQYDAKKNFSPDKILSYLPAELRKYWWRGFFDADGHISFKERANLSTERLSFSLASSYEQDWTFAESLMKELDIGDYQVYRHISKRGHKQSAIRMSGQVEILRVLNYLYDSYDYIGLPRKYLTYLQLASNLINRALRAKVPHQKDISLSDKDWVVLGRNFGNLTKALKDDIVGLDS